MDVVEGNTTGCAQGTAQTHRTGLGLDQIVALGGDQDIARGAHVGARANARRGVTAGVVQRDGTGKASGASAGTGNRPNVERAGALGVDQHIAASHRASRNLRLDFAADMVVGTRRANCAVAAERRSASDRFDLRGIGGAHLGVARRTQRHTSGRGDGLVADGIDAERAGHRHLGGTAATDGISAYGGGLGCLDTHGSTGQRASAGERRGFVVNLVVGGSDADRGLTGREGDATGDRQNLGSVVGIQVDRVAAGGDQRTSAGSLGAIGDGIDRHRAGHSHALRHAQRGGDGEDVVVIGGGGGNPGIAVNAAAMDARQGVGIYRRDGHTGAHASLAAVTGRARNAADVGGVVCGEHNCAVGIDLGIVDGRLGDVVDGAVGHGTGDANLVATGAAGRDGPHGLAVFRVQRDAAVVHRDSGICHRGAGVLDQLVPGKCPGQARALVHSNGQRASASDGQRVVFGLGGQTLGQCDQISRAVTVFVDVNRAGTCARHGDRGQI